MRIVPTHVGVNRRDLKKSLLTIDCPHSCGGEPPLEAKSGKAKVIVPTHVGVNLSELPTRAQMREIVPTHVGVNSMDGNTKTPPIALSPLMWG